MEHQEFEDEYPLDEQAESTEIPEELDDTDDGGLENTGSPSSNSADKGALTILLESVGFDLLKTDTVKTVCAIAAILGIIGFLTIDRRIFVVTLIAMAVYVLDEAVSCISLDKVTDKLPKFKNNITSHEESREDVVEQDNETEE